MKRESKKQDYMRIIATAIMITAATVIVFSIVALGVYTEGISDSNGTKAEPFEMEEVKK